MIDKSAMEKELGPMLDALKKLLYLKDWTITLEAGQCYNDAAMGQNEMNYRYEQSFITLDPGRHDSIEEARRTLFHEMVHILHAPFNEVLEIAASLIGEDPKMRAALKDAFDAAQERTVLHIERALLGGVGIDLAKLQG